MPTDDWYHSTGSRSATSHSYCIKVSVGTSDLDHAFVMMAGVQSIFPVCYSVTFHHLKEFQMPGFCERWFLFGLSLLAVNGMQAQEAGNSEKLPAMFSTSFYSVSNCGFIYMGNQHTNTIGYITVGESTIERTAIGELVQTYWRIGRKLNLST